MHPKWKDLENDHSPEAEQTRDHLCRMGHHLLYPQKPNHPGIFMQKNTRPIHTFVCAHCKKEFKIR